MNVEAWLKELGLEQYAEAFAENGIDFALFPELTNEDLKDLGVTRLDATHLRDVDKAKQGQAWHYLW